MQMTGMKQNISLIAS